MDLVGEFRKELLRIVDGQIGLLDPRHGRLAHRKLHALSSLACLDGRCAYLGRNSFVKVAGKSTGTVPCGCRYAKVARACCSVIWPVIGQIWLTVAKACSFVSGVMLGYS